MQLQTKPMARLVIYIKNIVNVECKKKRKYICVSTLQEGESNDSSYFFVCCLINTLVIQLTKNLRNRYKSNF